MQTEKDTSGNALFYYYIHYAPGTGTYSTACYYCMVDASEASIDVVTNSTTLSTAEKTARYKAYYLALGREKYDLVKLSDYVNGSETQS